MLDLIQPTGWRIFHDGRCCQRSDASFEENDLGMGIELSTTCTGIVPYDTGHGLSTFSKTQVEVE